MSTQPFHLPTALLEVGAVRLSTDAPFTWASGLKSPIYCDNRQLLGFPAVRADIAETLVTTVTGLALKPTLVAGTSTAGIPWATLVAGLLNLPLAYVRPEPKLHGMGRQVEGPPAGKHRVILLEDLISTGGSSIKCVKALKAEGAEEVEVLALFTYELRSAEAAFRDAGITLHTLATLTELEEKALKLGTIAETGHESLTAWRSDPEKWSKEHGG